MLVKLPHVVRTDLAEKVVRQVRSDWHVRRSARDHGEQRLGIVSLFSQIRISTLDIARDAGIEIPTSRPLDFISNRAALTMDILIRLIAFHCLSYTFHCTLTYDPDYFLDADHQSPATPDSSWLGQFGFTVSGSISGSFRLNVIKSPP
jgi:hypothetical protein